MLKSFRGKRNEPSYTKYVVEKIAQILDLSVDTVEKITTNNAKTLFKEF
jgi:TatD DNase family protein